MAKHLTDDDVEKIVGLLDGWVGKLTWDRLVEESEAEIGHETTRQTLSSFFRIKDAFTSKKSGGQGSAKWIPDNVPKPQSLKIATDRIIKLTDENERLKRESRGLMEQFVIWQYNAHIHQLSEEQLNKPLPAIDRELTKK
jgi:hypothetical protein